ncbi:MAG: glycosyltransferase family 4 protein [Methylococcaceae bacterium]|nr:glycosyltransferase family 4 protein [Methylococcaceae bacterium]
MKKKIRIRTLYPNYFCNHSATYACIAVSSAMARKNIEVSVMGISSDIAYQWPYYKNCIPAFLSPIAFRVFSRDKLRHLTELRFFSGLQKQDIAYLWPSTSLALFKKIKSNGNIIVMENINCHQHTSLKILQAEYASLGITDNKLNEASIEKSSKDESSKLDLCDFVFTPSVNVTNSLLDSGVAPEKIISSSYGLSDDEIFPYQLRKKKEGEPLTAIFVGRVGIRKGIHLLLDYWVNANIDGVLKIYGNIEKTAEAIIKPYLNHSKIQFVGFTKDIKQCYRDADFFILPSLEEGSPLVTYLALGAGLPCLVSPMGGAGVVKDGLSGSIIDPYDKEGWINAIRSIVFNNALRESQSKAAHQSADYFLWKNVGQRRADQLLEKLNILE